MATSVKKFVPISQGTNLWLSLKENSMYIPTQIIDPLLVCRKTGRPPTDLYLKTLSNYEPNE